jgi:hypothetical protein
MKFHPCDVVIVVLHSPREKLLGLLDSIEPAGITIRSIDLSYFDDWCSAIASGEPHLEMLDNFYPMWRVERISRDDGGSEVPSMAEQFLFRTGRHLSQQ